MRISAESDLGTYEESEARVCGVAGDRQWNGGIDT